MGPDHHLLDSEGQFFDNVGHRGEGMKIMNLQTMGWLTRASVAAVFVATLGFTDRALAAAAAPAAVLTPDQISKLLADGTNMLSQGNAELAIKNYFEPVNQSFMRQTAKAGR